MSLALRDDLKRLDWRLLPGRCKAGTFGWDQGIEECDILLTYGDIVGENGEGDITDTDEGELGGEGKA